MYIARDAPRVICPSCSAPIVATNPTLLFFANASERHSRISATVVKIGILLSGRLVDMALIELKERVRQLRSRDRWTSIDENMDNVHPALTMEDRTTKDL